MAGLVSCTKNRVHRVWRRVGDREGDENRGVSDSASFDARSIEDQAAGVGVDVVSSPGDLADYLSERTRVHGERRGREMEEAAKTLEGLGVEPIMAEAAWKRLLAGDE